MVAFHYAMIDFFSVMPREGLERSIVIGLDRESDWTFNCPTATPEPMMAWISLFGMHSPNAELAERWIASLTLRQLCAVCVLGRAVESVNIPYIVATALEPRGVKSYAEAVNERYPYVGVQDLIRFLENFLFYFTLEESAEQATTGE